MTRIHDTEQPPMVGWTCIGFLLSKNEYPATNERKASVSYTFQVPYPDGSVLKHTFYPPRDGSSVGNLKEGQWYAVPFDMTMKKDKSGISLSITGECVEPPR